jgi:hypothetical protein
MLRYADIRFARMSSGHRCLIRDLGLVKGGKGLRHHDVVLELSWRGLLKFAASRIRGGQSQPEGAHQAEARNLFLAKALPDPDLKYRSSERAVTSSATAT